MIILKATDEIIELETSSAADIDVSVSYADIDATDAVLGSEETAIASATTTTILSAPAASTQRQVKQISVSNKGTVSNTVTVKKDIAGTEYVLYKSVLRAGEGLSYVDGNGFTKKAVDGSPITLSTTDKRGPINAISKIIFKVGAAMEAAGILHCHYNASGQPGAWTVGTPGVSGRATDGTTSTDNGCIKIPNALSGINYLTQYFLSATVVGLNMLWDFLWVNSGLVVTTTTAQTVNSVAFPARDANGSTNGEDVGLAILVTTATTNAGAITTITASYTNQDGVSGRTATIASFPATAVAGSVIPFQLQAGDTGVRSVQSITLGTTLGGGAISLIAYRNIDMVPVTLVNTGNIGNLQSPKNIRLYDGVCLIPVVMASGTTATTIIGGINVEEK